MLLNKDKSYAEFKIGVKNKNHLMMLKDITMVPLDTIINTTSIPPAIVSISPPSPFIYGIK